MVANIVGTILYPLQLIDFTSVDYQSDPKDLIPFGITIAVVVIVLIIVNKQRQKPSANSAKTPRAGGSAGGGFNPFAGIAFHNKLRNMGMGREQIKIVDFVFKQDNVGNPEHSLNSPALLDRHFRKAYRIIGRSSHSREDAQQRLSLMFSARNIIDSQTSEIASSTRQIPENSDAVLGFDKNTYPVKVLSAKGDHLVIENPRNAMGSNIKIPRGSKVTLAFFTKSSKGFSFESRIIGAGESGGGYVLQLIHSNKVSNLSKRRFRRRDVTIPAFFYLVKLEELGKKKTRMVVDKRRQVGSIMDISIGGCSIKTNLAIPTGTRLKIEATYGEELSIAVLGQVLRTNRTGIKTILHISFLKVPHRSLNAINALVFEYENE